MHAKAILLCCCCSLLVFKAKEHRSQTSLLDHRHAWLQQDAAFLALAYTQLDDGGRKQRCAAVGFEIISILVMHSSWPGM